MRAVALGAVVLSVLMPGTGEAYEPRVNYQLQCMGCHLVDGTGESGRVPSFRGTFIPLSMIPEGRQFVLRVPGVAQSPLSDEEIAALLNWIARNLSDAALPAGFTDYTAREVADLRRQPLAQVAAMRTELLKRISVQGAR
jgi:mono/diheme cytochrome c family protein